LSHSLADDLLASQQLVAAMMMMAADDPSARVGAWSLRDIAAHLAASERECFEPRIRAMAAGERPAFEYYTNDETDFSGTTLEAALDDWSAARARLADLTRDLTDDERGRVGFHERFGEITVERYLEIALEHDRDHLAGVERVAGARRR
jgi:hypothetical protein